MRLTRSSQERRPPTRRGEQRRFGTIGLSLVRVYALPCLVAAGLTFVWKRQIGRFADGALIVSAAFALTTLPGIVSGIPTAAAIERAPVQGAGGPDIYYIVLDGYGRADVLEELYGHDNGPFLDGLRDRGFYVADEAYSNYAVTPLSLAGTLNMR